MTLSGIDSTIFLAATVTTETDTCTVTIRGSHTNIVSIVHNGATVFEKAEDHAAEPSEEPTPLIHTYTLAQLAEYAQTVPVEEIAFIQSAYDVNLALYQEGIDSPRHGGDGKDHRGDLRGKNGITRAPCSPHPAQKNCQP